MKVLLISPNSLTTPYPVYPLGLDYVADAVREDHEVRIADINPLGGLEALGKTIEGYAPDMVGMSLRNIDNTDKLDPSGFMGEYQACVNTVRKHSPAPLVLGGSGFTLFPEEIMKQLGAEYGIVGEGERLGALLEAIENAKDVSGIPGILTPEMNPQVLKPLDRAFALNYLCARSQLGYYLKNGGMLNLQTKRGCPFGCIYCTYPRIEGRQLRRVPPEMAAARALRLQEAGAKYFFVTDSAFNADYDHSARVAEAFMDAGVSIPWGAFFAPTTPPDGYYQTLANAGLSHVEFGTESLSDKMLTVYGKPFLADHVFKAHKQALAAGLYVAHYFMLGGPGEDEKTIAKTLSRISELQRSVFFFFVLCASIPIRRCMRWRLNRVRYRTNRVY
ncbi:MAG: B12-binding domain-containing radical SAM protein [Thermodesulfobacteriota bacterium]